MADADNNGPERRHSHGGQMLGSLAVALLIAVGVIYAVTARLGPTSIAQWRAQEELEEERQGEAEEAREERADERDDRSGRRHGRSSDRREDEDRRDRD